MRQYIDKDAAISEIKRLSAYLDSFHEQRVIEKILSILDTLEVKEVDLEKELSYDDYMGFFEKYPNFPDDWGYDEARIFANYFFKLGLKTQKGK